MDAPGWDVLPANKCKREGKLYLGQRCDTVLEEEPAGLPGALGGFMVRRGKGEVGQLRRE
jgi:hypothetical protein